MTEAQPGLPTGFPVIAELTALMGRDTFAGPVRAELIDGGKSNLTYRMTDGQTSWALRRPPLGHVLPTAHDMSREFRLLTALSPTGIPVPAPVAITDDASFYVMEWVDGAVYRTLGQSAKLGSSRALALAKALMSVLADIHTLDPADVGLADFGRPEGFLERQLSRWRRQLDASRTRPLPGIDELHAKLVRTVPDSPAPSIVHGDYRLDNLIIGPHDAIAAVVDWEMTTVGDPMTDLGLLVVYWDGLSDLPGSVSEAVGPASPFPRSGVLIEHYARLRSTDLTTLPWYVGFGYFKLAVINEGIYRRHLAGQTVGPGFEGIGESTHRLVDLGHETLEA